MSDFENRVQTYKQRQIAIETRLFAIEAERQRLSPAAVDGDRKAIAAIDALDSERSRLVSEQATITAAASQVEQLMRDEQLAGERKAALLHDNQSNELAASIATLNSEIDQALINLRQIFERRADLLGALTATPAGNSPALTGLARKFGPTGAACHAGLQRYLALEVVAAGAARPLASANELLEGIGTPAPRSSRRPS